MDITMTFSRSDLLSIALAVSAAAASSEEDERLNTAATQYRLAAKLWAASNYQRRAADQRQLAVACEGKAFEARMDTLEDEEGA